VSQPYGAPAGTLEAFIEVPFKLGDKQLFPDGLIRISRGQRLWTALVEVKTGSNRLQAEQLENYLDVAREQGFDAVITISNEVPPLAGQHPTAIDKRTLKKVALHHLLWTEILTLAVMQKEFRGVADTEQAWILGELIRYLEHPKSGAMGFDDMGPAWVPGTRVMRNQALAVRAFASPITRVKPTVKPRRGRQSHRQTANATSHTAWGHVQGSGVKTITVEIWVDVTRRSPRGRVWPEWWSRRRRRRRG
jgi:hypothetical protein